MSLYQSLPNYFRHQGYITTSEYQSADSSDEKGGLYRQGYASMNNPDDGVEYRGYNLAVTKQTYHQSCVGLHTNQGNL